jgi:transposase
LAYFVLDVLESLDLSAIEEVLQAKDARGTRSYNPRMMAGLLLYAYYVGVFSSRRIAKATHEDVAFRVLYGGEHPHFTRICAFRRDHQEALEDLFLQVLKLCKKAGLVKLGHVAIDGTKIQGNASKHKAMSYKRMLETEARLEKEIASLMAQAEARDTDEDHRFGADKDHKSDIPDELKRRTHRLARIQEAKAALEQKAREARAAHERELAIDCKARAAEAPANAKLNTNLAEKHRAKAEALAPEQDDDDDNPPFTTGDGLPKHRVRTTPEGKPTDKAQRNFTDPDSRIMESGGSFLQGYNCQAAVDDERQVIVAQTVTNQPPDAGNLIPVLDLVQQNTGSYPETVSADSGYWQEGVSDACAKRDLTPLIATERRKHYAVNEVVTDGPPPPGLSAKEKMQWSLRTKEGRALYSRRKVIVEPVFGKIKDVRGLKRLLLRGLEGAGLEWSLLCTTHNLLKLFRSQSSVPTTT